MTHNEQQFLIWVCVSLLSVIAFCGILFVKYFVQLVNDVNQIKTTIQVQGNKHENLERRVEILEDKI